MSFDDLPRDWPRRPLSDPVLTADVIDLVVSDADRRSQGLGFLLCRPGGTLGQPFFVGAQEYADPCQAVTLMTRAAEETPGVAGLVLVLARSGGPVDDADRSVHQHAIDVTRAAGLTLWGTYLATRSGVTALPVAADLGPPRKGAG
jgi:hypothetical protein